MKVLLKLSTQPGAPASERRLEVASLRIGRGADQDLVLSDPRIALAHAEISPQQGLLGRRYRIEAKAKLSLLVNGGPSHSEVLGRGDVVELGRYRLTVVADDHADLALLVEDRYSGREERGVRREDMKLSLAEAGWSRRRWAWGLFLLVLAGGLLLPLLPWLGGAKQEVMANRELLPSVQPGADIVWNSGPISTSHHVLRNDCVACHRKPFEPVSDAACRDCHSPLGEHPAEASALLQAPFANQQCTDCHREHNGLMSLSLRDNRACTSCHADPGQLPQGRDALLVKDFSHSHPPFSLSLARREGERFVWKEFPQARPEARHQDSGLKFPHDLHLAKKGIDAPGGIKHLDCGDCHQPNADRSGFLPVTMEKHCADCHRLDFDPAAPERELPHGKPAEVVRIVRDHYAALALTGRPSPPPLASAGGERRLPGAAADAPAGRSPAWAEARAQTALRDVFERRTCFYCHTVSKDGPAESPWRIAPVAAQQPALRASLFPHSRHASETCASCHAAQTSKQAEDVLLPDIAHCRDCHADTGAMTQTPSPCQSCHGYHQHPPLTAAGAAKPEAAR